MIIKTNKNIIFYILLLIPFFKPVGPSIYDAYNTFFLVWKFISLSVLLVILLKRQNGSIYFFESDKWIRGLIVFFAIYLFNCIRNDASDVIGAISGVVVILELLAILGTPSKKTRTNIYNALDWIFCLWLILHILSMFYIRSGHIIFEDLGDDFTYFLGTDNYSAFATIPMLSVIIFVNEKKKTSFSNIKTMVLSIGLCVGYIFTGAVAASISSVLLTAAWFISKSWKNIARYITIRKVVIVMAIILILIMGFDIQNNMLWLLGALGKAEQGTTLNSRTIIWGLALNFIEKNPILGVGELSSDDVQNYALYGMGHAHNLFLDLLLKTGVIGTIAYLYFYIGVLSKYRKKLMGAGASILIFSLITFFILSMLDDYPFIPYIYCCVGILWGYAKYEDTELPSGKQK